MTPYVFGTYPNDNTPAPYSFNGQSGWWTVPLNWYFMTDTNQQQWCSPNADFSNPKYAVKTNYDGTAVFQDVMRNTLAGLTNPV